MGFDTWSLSLFWKATTNPRSARSAEFSVKIDGVDLKRHHDGMGNFSEQVGGVARDV